MIQLIEFMPTYCVMYVICIYFDSMRLFSYCECIFNVLPKVTCPLIYQSALVLRYQADNVGFFSIFLLKNCSVPNKFLTVGESGRSMSNAPSVGKTPHCGQVLLEVNVVHPCSESVFGVLNSYRALCRAFDFWQG